MHEETAMDFKDVTSEVCAKKEDIHNAGFQGAGRGTQAIREDCVFFMLELVPGDSLRR